MNSYEAKQEARKERLEQAAENARRRSDSAYQRSSDIVGGIPMGQPILVGHHSEGRHRRDLERSDNAMRRGHDESEKAKELEYKAAAVGRGGISSDDPDAIQKLIEKLGEMKVNRALMKEVNAAFRRSGRPDPDNGAGWQKMAASLGLDLQQLAGVRLDLAKFPYHRQPYPKYALTNLGANIKRVERRIVELGERVGDESSEHQVGDVIYRNNVEENRVQIEFRGKPSAAVRDILKAWGFRWAPTVGCWQRQLTHAGQHSMAQVERLLEELPND